MRIIPIKGTVIPKEKLSGQHKFKVSCKEKVPVGPKKKEPSKGFTMVANEPWNRGVKGYDTCPNNSALEKVKFFADTFRNNRIDSSMVISPVDPALL